MRKTGKSWQDRLSQAPSAEAVEFVESISVDRRLYRYDIAGSLAHAQMLAEEGLLSRGEWRGIKRALEALGRDIEGGRFRFDKGYEDIHMVLEAALIKRLGPAGGKLHTGRSRNDQVALDLRLWSRDCAEELARVLRDLQAALVELAGRQGELVMPGYTHLQRAQPIVAGQALLAYVEMFERDRQRLLGARGRLNVCPLGSGALAGSSLPLNRRRTAELLGFPAISRNSLDAVSDRDFGVELVFCCATAAMHLSRLAEDWIIFCSQEFGFIRLDDAYCTGSSMMPQKRNPDLLELIRGRCGGVYGNLMALLTMLKGQPLAYNRDMQEDKKQLFDATDTVRSCVEMAAAIVRHTRFVPERIAAGLEEGYLDATALAEYLVVKGVAFREAHQIVGRLVAQAEREGKSLAELGLKTLRQACGKIDRNVHKCLTAKNVAASYVTAGAAGGKQLKEQLAFWRRELKGA